jgi:hypothetical protein
MTREESLEIFSDPHGRHRNVLKGFLGTKVEKDALAAIKES